MHMHRPYYTLIACAAAALLAAPFSAHAQEAASPPAVDAPAPLKAEKGLVLPAESETPPSAPQAPPESTLSPIDILSTQSAKDSGLEFDSGVLTHAALSIAPDRSELVRLDADAASIIVGNPFHLSVVADSPRTLVLIPKAPGATFFTVLDKDGQILMQRHILIATPKEKYVRIRKTCTNSAQQDCQTTNVYYCPDTCHPILLDDSAGATAPEVPQAAPEDAYYDEPETAPPTTPADTDR